VVPIAAGEKNRLLNIHPDVSQYLGRTELIKASSAKSFARKITPYIDSENQHSGVNKSGKTPKKRGRGGKGSKVGEGSNAGGETGCGHENQVELPKPGYIGDVAQPGSGESTDSDRRLNTKPALWPLVRHVNIRCNAKALSTGAILVDLPGNLTH
jgi:hypothetical protein